MAPKHIEPQQGERLKVPADWHVMSFGDVAIKRAEPVSVGSASFYREIGIRSHGKGIFHKGPANGDLLGDKRVFWVRANCLVFNIVFAWEGAVAVTGHSEDGMIASHRFPMFNSGSDNLVDVEFLRRFFQTPLGVRLLGEASPGGAGRNRTLTQKLLHEVPVPVPPLWEQKKIAAILDAVDDAIEGTQAVIDQFQVVKKAMMAELLTRGLPGRHARFKQTTIGEVPDTWDVTPIGAVCERMFVGIAQAATHAYVPEGGVPLIRSTNVRANHLRTDDIQRINTTFAAEMRSKALRSGDVISARTGYPGTSVLVSPEFDGAQCFTMLVSRPGPRLHGQFLCHLMNSVVGERIVSHGQAGGAQQNLNVGVFEKASIALPTVEEQKAICGAINVAYEREWAEEASIRALESLKTALISVLLTGELRVTPDEAAP